MYGRAAECGFTRIPGGGGGVECDFEIARRPVTNAEYAAWLRTLAPDEARRRYSPLMEEHFWGGINADFSVKEGFAGKPVVFVSWFDAQAYAAAHGAKLPTEAQWRKAAAWDPAARRFAKYATGSDNAPHQREAIFYDGEKGWALDEPHLADVEWYRPSGAYGVCGMAGNVAEWVDGEPLPNGWRKALGGSVFRPVEFTETFAGEADSPEKRLSTFGFRIVKDADGVRRVEHGEERICECSSRGERVCKESAPGGIVRQTFVEVGDACNRLDGWRLGCVPYKYSIGKYQVTNAQWCEFLNACGGEGFHRDMERGILGGIECKCGRYVPKPGRENKPVTYVDCKSLMRYCNWLTCADPERGSYALDCSVPQRLEGGVYFLPTDDEWYKAAYYNPVTGKYARFTTGRDEVPTQTEANYQPHDHLAEGAPHYFADVDGYAAGASKYGCVQMGGNAWEFLEIVTQDARGLHNHLRGGSFGYTETGLAKKNRDETPFGSRSYVFGARIVRIEGGWKEEFSHLPAKYAIMRGVLSCKLLRPLKTAYRFLRGV
ncbi:MAG: SUMF1/EgtB/PvdO family nonheme iron enzyme [Kiritimatiellae bacterium]|nr:SUMF1/EgtB/PvdO family nonheme iron enzyme [Kiritimatiellia bacterium]